MLTPTNKRVLPNQPKEPPAWLKVIYQTIILGLLGLLLLGLCIGLISGVIDIFQLPTLSENRTVQNLPINIKQGMPYLEARGILIKDGWQIITMHTAPNGTPSCWRSDWDETKSPKISCDYAEVDSCSGTGMGFCKMWFFDGEDKYLKIITSGGEPGPVTSSGDFASVNFWEKMNLSDYKKENGR